MMRKNELVEAGKAHFTILAEEQSWDCASPRMYEYESTFYCPTRC